MPRSARGWLLVIPCLVGALLWLGGADATAQAEEGFEEVLRPWLAANPELKEWLAGGSTEAPRAYVEQVGRRVAIIVKAPSGLSPQTLAETILAYDVHRRTENVEVGFEADGAFFTGTKVMGFRTPTVTAHRRRIAGETLQMRWRLMPRADAEAWLDAHRAQLAEAMRDAGLDHDDAAVGAYLTTIKGQLGEVAEAAGGHELVDGYYRYAQFVNLRSKILDLAARKLGQASQREAALKTVCYSLGLQALAGAAGERGVTFQIRGNVGDGTLTPGP